MGAKQRGLLAAVCLLIATSQTSYAQQDVPFDPAVDVQLFEYAVGPKSFMTVSDAEVQSEKAFNVDFLLTFLTDPFTIYNTDSSGSELGTTRTEVVQSVLAGEISGAYGVMDKLQVGASLPMVFSMSGQGVDPTTAMPASSDLQISGLGDLRLEGKYRFYDTGALRMAAVGGITLPSSFGAGGNEFLGDDLPSVRAKAAAQWQNTDGKLTFGANLGVLFRKPRTLFASEVGQQLTYGAGAAFLFNDRVSAVGEVFGRGPINFDLSGSPLEAGGGVRVKATSSISVLAGGGAGLVQGIGSPGLRFFVSVGWSPDFRDSDRDGVRNDQDKCVLEPEDRDGFEDDDGCPDNDNDGDKRLDAEDKCPNEREDIDGHEDDDGCPEPDNDGDSFLDVDDRCPNHAEDGLQPYPKDGCPGTQRDSDDDGVPDADDACPMDPEDKDGFEDWDGCEDADNDKDGVADEDDQCPVCAEDKDGDADDDGCPDVGPSVDPRIARMDGDVLVFGTDVGFGRRDDLSDTGAKLVAKAAAVMAGEKGVTQWAVVVAVKKRGSTARSQAAADRRAAAVKDALIAGGVDASTLQVLAAVADKDAVRVIARTREEVEDTGEFVCPAQYVVEPRTRPAKPVKPATDASVPAGGGEGAVTDLGGGTKPETPKPEAPKTVPEAFARYTGAVKVEFKRNATEMVKGEDLLTEIANLLKDNPHVVAELGCHTDSRKGADKSKEITQGQCDNAAMLLTAQGVDPSQVKAVGYGMDEPVASNKTSKGRTQNRRVEIKYSVK